MKKNKTVIFLFVLVSSMNLYAAKPYQVFKEGQFDLDIETQYYKSTANFDADGKRTDLAIGNYYQIIDFSSAVRWGFSDGIGFKAGFNVGNTESSNFVATRTNSVFNRIDIGADYLLLDTSTFQIFAELMYSHALEKVSQSGDQVLTSNGASEIKPTLYARMDFDDFYPFAYIGANVRGEELSTLLTYGGGGEFRFESFGLGAAISGFTSVKDDKYTNQALVRDNVTMNVNAGSKKYFSINPSWLSSEFFVNFALVDEAFIKLYAVYDVAGSNMSQGIGGGAQVTILFDGLFGGSSGGSGSGSGSGGSGSGSSSGGSTKSKPRSVERSQKQKSTSPGQFQEDTQDGVNQDYFKPVTPSQDSYVQPIEESGPSASEQEQQELRDRQEKQELKKQMNELDYTIKLKKIKKKKKK